MDSQTYTYLQQFSRDSLGISHTINGQQLYWINGQPQTLEQTQSNLFWYGHL